MKLTVIGGGGVRSMFLAKSIAQKANHLGISEVVFMDNDKKKLDVFGKMAEKVSKRIAPQLKFSATLDAEEAIKNADYVITTIRVGGDELRVRDERAALNLGLLGQETTGAAGFSFAMRSIPALIEYCEMAKRYAKKSVKIFNFTNPAGIVSQALRDAGYDFTYGICDAPSGMLHQFAEYLGVSPSEVEGECYGINHLSFFKSVKVNGNERMLDLINDDLAYQKTDLRFFDKDLLKKIGCIPNEYLYYFYYSEQAVKNILAAPCTRGEMIAVNNREMLAALSKIDIDADFETALAVFEDYHGRRENAYMASETGVRRDKPWKFDVFGIDDGGYAGVALRYIELVCSGEKGRMILCVPNGNAIKGLAPTDVVEVSCDVDADGAKPISLGELPELNLEYVRRVKLYERLGALAILKRSKTLAVEALMVHPLVNSYSAATRLVDEFLKNNREYVTEWTE